MGYPYGRQQWAYPGREIGFGLEVLPVVLAAFEIPQVSLQGEGGEQEIGFLAQHALRVQHLLPQVPVVVVPRRPVAAGGERVRGRGVGDPTTAPGPRGHPLAAPPVRSWGIKTPWHGTAARPPGPRDALGPENVLFLC